MDKEKQIIRQFLKVIGNPELSPESCFDFDAQPFSLHGVPWLFTTDEYSYEDRFDDSHPYTLGWNVAAATISDILASGGEAMVYGHVVTVAPEWDDAFIEDLAKGIRDCLGALDLTFIGGDLGMGEAWKYTGIAIGRPKVSLSRKGAEAGDLIYMTGMAGGGNLQAATTLFPDQSALVALTRESRFRIPLRDKEAAVISRFASACIDSSDGLYQAVRTLAEVNQLGFILHDPPLLPEGRELCGMMHLPDTLLILGECGEYELVFTVPPGQESDMLSAAQAGGLPFQRIGKIENTTSFLLQKEGKTLDLTHYRLYARDYRDIHTYLKEMVQYIHYETQR